MPRFLHAAVRGLFYPAVIIAITIALAASHGAGDASAATHRAGAASVTRHHEPIAHIAKAPKGAKKPRTA